MIAIVKPTEIARYVIGYLTNFILQKGIYNRKNRLAAMNDWIIGAESGFKIKQKSRFAWLKNIWNKNSPKTYAPDPAICPIIRFILLGTFFNGIWSNVNGPPQNKKLEQITMFGIVFTIHSL